MPDGYEESSQLVAKMAQMHHDNLANALRLVVSACSCQSAAEPRYRALAGKKGMVECQLVSCSHARLCSAFTFGTK